MRHSVIGRPLGRIAALTVVAVIVGLAGASSAGGGAAVEQAHEACGVGEMRDGALVVEFAWLEALPAARGVACIVRELDGDGDWIGDAAAGRGSSTDEWGDVLVIVDRRGSFFDKRTVITFSQCY